MIGTYAKSTARQLLEALAAREISAVELAEEAISHIERLDPPINAVVVRDFDRALEVAKAADLALARGERRPLLGLPMTVKEAHNVAGLPTTWGSPAFGNWVAPSDSVGVARLKAAGAVILGKTNVPPFLSDWQSANPIYGRTNHPLDPTRTPGGSSGGAAAALAAGMVPLEFGSDIGGSIRVPAAFCGVFGHKPSHDLIPQRGHAPPGLEGAGVALGVVGPMARSAEDLELALSVLAGPDVDQAVAYRLALPAPRHASLADFRVLVIGAHPVAALDAEIAAALDDFARRLERAGATVARESDLIPDLAAAFDLYRAILMPIVTRGAPPRPDAASAEAWLNALDGQWSIRKRWAVLFESFDIVLAPAFGVVAFPHDDAPFESRVHVIDGQPTPYGSQVAWPALATLPNLPATAFPVGKTTAGLPIGLQAIGPYLEDLTPLAFARLASRL